jgi:hypothetical protein
MLNLVVSGVLEEIRQLGLGRLDLGLAH